MKMGQSTSAPARARPTIKELCWAAGFLEGEGHFGQAGSKKYPSEVVTGTQVQRGPLERLQRWFGGRIYLSRVYAKNQHAASRWHISGARARGVMLTLYAMLSTKRQYQIRAALQTREAKRV